MRNDHPDRERQPFCLGKSFGGIEIIAHDPDVRAQH
jgi:hypothetical protein